jgi:hypothetical protein
MKLTAAQRRDAVRRRHSEEWETARRHAREQVIAEFNSDVQAMAEAILNYRWGADQLAAAIPLLKRAAPFALLRPGPYWRGWSDEERARLRA